MISAFPSYTGYVIRHIYHRNGLVMAEVSYLTPAAYFKVKFHDVSPTKNQNPYFLGEQFGFTPTELWLGFREYFPMEYLKQLERHER